LIKAQAKECRLGDLKPAGIGHRIAIRENEKQSRQRKQEHAKDIASQQDDIRP
jgi:hypothetical protein